MIKCRSASFSKKPGAIQNVRPYLVAVFLGLISFV
jgi:hypothetical protein